MLSPLREPREVGDLAQMYGREGEAIERYHGLAASSMPSDCDFCKQPLADSEMAPQTIEWRTKEKKVGTEHKLLVKVETFSYHKQCGTYYLCSECRKLLRPPLAEILPKVLIPGLLFAPVAIWMGGDAPIAASLMWPALLCGGLLWWFSRSRFQGYPASMGFRLHETTFDGPHQRLIIPLFVLILLCFLAVGLLSGGGVPPNLQLGRMDGPGGTGTINMADIDRGLKDLASASGESVMKVGNKVVPGWSLHKQRGDHLYPGTPDFIRAVTDIVRAGTPKLSVEQAVDLVAKETAGQRLARLQQGNNSAPFADQAAIESAATQVATRTGASPWEVVKAVEELLTLAKASNLPLARKQLVELLAAEAGKHPGAKLDKVADSARIEMFRR